MHRDTSMTRPTALPAAIAAFAPVLGPERGGGGTAVEDGDGVDIMIDGPDIQERRRELGDMSGRK